MTYFPAWLGALAISAIALAHLMLLRRPLGVSGNLSTALDLEARAADKTAAQVSEADLEAELAAATEEMFGDQALAEGAASAAAASDAHPAAPPSPPALAPRLGWGASLRFLVGIVAGGSISALLAGVSPTFDVGDTYRALIGSGPIAWIALFVGGALVGFGTRMAAGCTSGHGLVGCASFRPGSLVATACFFGTGIAVSFALAGLAR